MPAAAVDVLLTRGCVCRSRTPLNGVLGMLQCMQATSLTDSQRDCVDTAIFSSEALVRTLNDILDTRNADGGHMAVSRRIVPLRSLMLMVEEVRRVPR
jgi:signal transduction histidine kinase